jgi:hypothetical protein
METTKPTKTISQLFEEFLADQKGRISAKTFSKYENIRHSSIITGGHAARA